jgi:hypothetical protein
MMKLAQRRAPLLSQVTLHRMASVRHGATSSKMQRKGSDTSRDTAPPASSWGFADTDSAGKTPLDKIYDEQFARTQKAFATPLPPLPADGTTPDFVIGFSQYLYRQRDQYRIAVASALGVSPRRVRLSIAWRGLFKTADLVGVHKTAGVTLLADGEGEERMPDGAEKRQMVKAVIETVNKRTNEALVELNVLRAAPKASNIVERLPTEAVQAAARELEALAASHAVLVLHDDASEALVNEQWRRVFFHHHAIPVLFNVSRQKAFPAAARAHMAAAGEAAGDGGGDDDEAHEELRLALLGKAMAAVTRGNGGIPCVFIRGAHVGSHEDVMALSRSYKKLRALLANEQ